MLPLISNTNLKCPYPNPFVVGAYVFVDGIIRSICSVTFPVGLLNRNDEYEEWRFDKVENVGIAVEVEAIGI